MGPQAVAPLAFVGVLSLVLAVFLAWNAKKSRAREALVRRLGERTADDARDALVRDEATGVARWLNERAWAGPPASW